MLAAALIIVLALAIVFGAVASIFSLLSGGTKTATQAGSSASADKMGTLFNGLTKILALKEAYDIVTNGNK